jgi:hypothetical protein
MVSTLKVSSSGASAGQRSHRPAANSAMPSRDWMKYGRAGLAVRSHL